jgi:cytochrome c5
MRLMLLGAVGAAALATTAIAQIQNTATLNPKELRPVASFTGIADQTERSRAIFNEIGKVVTHPRCLNCHPVGDHPLQGADHHEHRPPVPRGEANVGVAGLTCQACHTERNFTLVGVGDGATYKSIPGNPRWSLAPKEFAWEGKSLGEICRQIKDEKRNGGRSLALLHEHFAKDDLVGWGWAPGEGREPAPGTQAELGELVQAWIDTGAACPN